MARRHEARTALKLVFPDESNDLLSALPADVYARLASAFETVSVAKGEVLSDSGVAIRYVHFPQTGCLSVVAIMDDGKLVEVGTVGWEGMTGISLLHGVDSVPLRCFVQIKGVAKRLPRAEFVARLRDTPELSSIMHRYAQVWSEQVSRGGACNAVHSVNERFARWLLITHDRTETDELPLTQDFLAIMLGVRRPTVTLTAALAQRAGLIRYARGKITVIDRQGLEDAACECYAAMRASYDRLLPTQRERGQAAM